MTLKNEIFEGLGAATAAKKLVYDPRDDYYDQIAQAAKDENERRRKQEAILTGNRTASQQGGPAGPAGRAPSSGSVPVAASTKTAQMPTIPGMPAPQQVATAPTYGGGWGTSYPPSVIDTEFGSRAARGGRIKKPRKVSLRAIHTNFRHGGPVTPPDDDDEGEEFGMLEPVLPRGQRPPEPGTEGNPRNPQWPRYRNPSIIREPAEDDPQRGNPYQRDPEPGADRPFPGSMRRYDIGGPVEGEDNEADLIIQGILQRDLANRPGMAVPRRAGPMSSMPSPADRMRALAQRPGGQTAMTTQPPTRGFQGSPNLSSPTGVDEPVEPPQPFQASPNLSARTGVDEPVIPLARAPEHYGPAPSSRQAAMIEAQRRGRAEEATNAGPQLADSEFADQQGMPQAPTSSRFGRATQQPERIRRLQELDKPEMELRAQRQQANPGMFEQTTPGEQARRAAEVAEIDRKLEAIAQQREAIQRGEGATVGAGTGLGAGTQTAARATGPTGTTQPPAPPPGGNANAPTTAPKGSPQAMRTLPMWAERANPLDVPGLYSAPPARGAGGGGGGGGTAGGGTAVQTGAPPRLGMSDPNRVDAYDPTQDYNDPTRRRTNEELAQVLTGATTQMPLGPNGQMPAVGQGAVSRHVGQAYVARYDGGGRWEPGEAILRGMLSDYKTLLSFGRLEEANKMAAGLIQYANLEAASHAHVAEDLVKQGDFYGALRNVVSAAGYLPDGMQHKVGADGKSVDTIDPRTGKVTANTPVDGRWLLAAIGGFKNGDLLWATLNAAVQSTRVDKNAEGRALSNMIRRNTLKLQEARLKRGPGGRAGMPGMSETEKRLAQIRANISGGAPPGTAEAAPPAQGSNDTSDEVNPALDPED